MFNSLDKLLKSNRTILLLSIILIPYLIYALFHSTSVKKIIPQAKSTKTLEEIVATPVNTAQEAPWDTEFKSKVEAAK